MTDQNANGKERPRNSKLIGILMGLSTFVIVDGLRNLSKQDSIDRAPSYGTTITIKDDNEDGYDDFVYTNKAGEDKVLYGYKDKRFYSIKELIVLKEEDN